MSLVPGAYVLAAATNVSIVLAEKSPTGFAVESLGSCFPISLIEEKDDGFTHITYHVEGKKLTSTLTKK
ncbi:MAG: hypothetical protein AAB388_03810 [Patescibacteria group bacterium]